MFVVTTPVRELEQLLTAPYPDDAFGRIEPTLYLTAAMTGLRQGELLGLRWRDVDFDAQSSRRLAVRPR
jgi:integrase